MSNKITVTKPAALGVSSPGIHPINCSTYRRRLTAAGSWNFKPLTEEQICQARVDFISGCAQENHDVKVSASWRPGTAATRGLKISESLNEAIQAPMDQAAIAATIERMKIEIKDGEVIAGNGGSLTVAEYHQEQRESQRLILDQLDRDIARKENSGRNPCAEIVLDEPEPDVLTSVLAEKKKKIEENLAKLKAGQTLNASEKVMMEQHIDELQLRLKLKEKENALAGKTRHTKYTELMTTQFQERSDDLRQYQSIRDEINNISAVTVKPPTPRGISGDDIRLEGEPIKPKMWIDREADCIILKSDYDRAEDRIHRIGCESKRPCPDCGGSGEYVGFNHTEICPSCKGSKVI